MAVGDDGSLRLSLGRISLQSGAVLDDAVLAVRTFGHLNMRADNAVLVATSFGASHRDFEWMVGADSLFDPARYFIVIANLFGNGLSTSPSNSAAFAAGERFPLVTALDNALVQKFVLDRVFKVRRVAMALGWSMGGQVAWHLAALFPHDIIRLVPICATARTAPHNHVFLEGAKAVLQADGAYDPGSGRFTRPPERALKALGRFYAGWALSQEFYRAECWRDLGHATVEDFLTGYWEAAFAKRDPDNLLAHIATWQAADISANARYAGDLPGALAAIRARVLLMPGASDLYFQQADVEAEARHLADARLAPIVSPWGHRAGNPLHSPADRAFITRHVRALLAG